MKSATHVEEIYPTVNDIDPKSIRHGNCPLFSFWRVLPGTTRNGNPVYRNTGCWRLCAVHQ
ncbi:MAG: hypothetical protein VB858_09350, partial [Planctomycetaceae bacterium]